MMWLWILIGVFFTTSASALGPGELAGFVAADVRVFPFSPAFPEQLDRSVVPSLVLQPEYRYGWNNGHDRITIVPFGRLEYGDDNRTHFDLRELNWLHVGPSWDLLFGVGKVFWGVTESRHLVDLINQTDLVEDIDTEDKLGQPMFRFTLLRNWGTLTLFALPRFRERTFPGPKGRLRTEPYVDTDDPVFESSLKQWQPDFAVRWTHTLDAFDIGLAYFYGTSREPRLLPRRNRTDRVVLIPHYDLIHQASLDVQFAMGNWLGKLEAMTRSGHGPPFAALVAGFEYTFYGIFDTAFDLGVLGEYLYDGRGDEAPLTPFNNDAFVGVRLTFNDVQSTEVLAGGIVDLDTRATLLNLEASRRIGQRWKLEVEVRAFANILPSDVLFSVRRDDYIQVRVARFF